MIWPQTPTQRSRLRGKTEQHQADKKRSILLYQTNNTYTEREREVAKTAHPGWVLI
jgi:hypothetical protein